MQVEARMAGELPSYARCLCVPQLSHTRVDRLLKYSPSQLGDQRVWSAFGSLVRKDVERLQPGLRLTDRLIRVGLPKLSADDMERLSTRCRGLTRSTVEPSRKPRWMARIRAR